MKLVHPARWRVTQRREVITQRVEQELSGQAAAAVDQSRHHHSWLPVLE